MTDAITAGGKVDAPIPQQVFWCTFEGLVAITLLLGGGLGALQAMVISTGLPFTILPLLICVVILKGLQQDLQTLPRTRERAGDRRPVRCRRNFSLAAVLAF